MDFVRSGLILLCVGLLPLKPALAQGCSDAGFCSIGALKPQPASVSSQPRQRLTILAPVGLGDEGVLVLTPALQYDNQLTSRWAVQAKLTGNVASGNLGRATGPGDVFLSGIYGLPTARGWTTLLTFATKLPLNRSTLTADGAALPMQYQSSLGTVDIVAGVSASNGRWQLSAGWQQPLSGSNANTFLPGRNPWPEATNYPPSNRFDRRADVLLRTAFNLVQKSRLTANVGLLGIYHLGQDSYTDALGNAVQIAGSQGLTLNLTAGAWWNVGTRMRLGLTAGKPLVARKVRPDGLTRSIVFAPEVSWSF